MFADLGILIVCKFIGKELDLSTCSGLRVGGMALEPLDKSLIRQQGDCAIGVKSREFVRYLAQARFAKNKVPCRGEDRGQLTDTREA